VSVLCCYQSFKSSQVVTLAGYIKALTQHAKNVPKYLPLSLLKSGSPFDWSKTQGVAGRLGRAGRMDSTPENKSEKPEKSYLSAAVESFSPWGPSSSSRSSTPKPLPPIATKTPEGSGLKNQHAGDHTTQHWRGLSSARYPSDCPPLNPRWYYAVDVC